MKKQLISYSLVFLALQPALGMAMDGQQPGSSNDQQQLKRQLQEHRQRLLDQQQADMMARFRQANPADAQFLSESNQEDAEKLCVMCQATNNTFSLPCHEMHRVCEGCSNHILNARSIMQRSCPICRTGLRHAPRTQLTPQGIAAVPQLIGENHSDAQALYDQVVGYEQATADQAAAQLTVAYMFFDGFGGAQVDHPRARTLLVLVAKNQAAYDRDRVDAQFWLAIMCAKGIGGDQNLTQARSLLRQVANNPEVPLAMRTFARIYRAGTYLPNCPSRCTIL